MWQYCTNPTKTVRTTLEISSVFCDFFKDLYSSKVSYEEAELQSFLDSIMLSELLAADREVLDKPLTLEELWVAAASTPNNKAPGADGFPGEIYKKYGANLLPQLLEVFNVTLECGYLASYMNEAIIIV